MLHKAINPLHFTAKMLFVHQFTKFYIALVQYYTGDCIGVSYNFNVEYSIVMADQFLILISSLFSYGYVGVAGNANFTESTPDYK